MRQPQVSKSRDAYVWASGVRRIRTDLLLDRALTDSQLRTLIAEASEILKDRRRERMDPAATERTPLPDGQGEFMYYVKTSYSRHIKGHAPAIFRLEPHDGGFVAVPLAARIGGSQRPMVTGHYPAKNGEVFKIVRENGEYSYQVPFNGTIHNLRQFADLSGIGIFGLDALRPFLECVEPETFERITSDSVARLSHIRGWLDEYRDQIERWRKREFWADEAPANKREYREMLKRLRMQQNDSRIGSPRPKRSSNDRLLKEAVSEAEIREEPLIGSQALIERAGIAERLQREDEARLILAF